MATSLTHTIDLHGVAVQLTTTDPAIHADWQMLFAGFAPAGAPAGVRLTLNSQAALPPLPADALRRTLAPPGQRAVTVVTRADGTQQIELPGLARLTPGDGAIALDVVQAALDAGQLEDITLIGLAPLLRRRGLYMVHAFGVQHAGRALLLVGRSGSGKTTGGLNLLLHGWGYLANDVVLLRRAADGVQALAGPGAISITPQTLALLPALAARLGTLPALPPAGKWTLPAAALATPVGGALVAALVFPGVVGGQTDSTLRRLPAALALAQLMEQSVDSWDAPTLPAHLDLLQALVGQARSFELRAGGDFARQAALLAAAAAQ